MGKKGLSELRAELTAAGVYEHASVAGWLRVAALVGFTVACLGALTVLPLWTGLLLLPVAALATTSAAMVGHEGSHGSFASARWNNRLITTVTFPLMSGVSALYWRHKHDGLHHGHPNVENVDPDLDLWPMATSSEDHLKAGPARRWFQRNLQGWAFWPLTSFMVLGMRKSSIEFLVARARKKGIDAEWVIDAAAVLTHYVTWFVLGTMVFGLLPLLAIYTVFWGCVSLYLALIFAPAHIGLPVLNDQYPDWFHQMETTRNLRVPRWSHWFFVGLDHQIEHHLFPRIPHQHLPRASAIVKAWSDRVGAPHRSVTYAEAVASVTRTLRDAWSVPAAGRDAVRAEWQVAPAADAAVSAEPVRHAA